MAGRRRWDPRFIPNTFAGYRADIGITIATGVSQWDDQTGNGHHLAQATAGHQPLVVTGAGGRPTIRHDGIDDFLQGVFTVPKPFTYVIVYKIVSGPGAGHDGLIDGCTAATALVYFPGATTSLYDTTVGPSVVVPHIIGNGVYAYAMFGFQSGGGSFIRENGTDYGPPGSQGAAATDGITLGALGIAPGSAQRFLNVEIAELWVLGKIPSAAERLQLDAYLKTAYAL